MSLPLPTVLPAPDMSLLVEPHDFFHVERLDNFQTCSDETCHEATKLAISTAEDVTGSPYCAAHSHILFAYWMIGAGA
jgi:hypothetical protein